MASRAVVIQHKTQRPVQFEIMRTARDALQSLIKLAGLKPEDSLFPSRLHESPDIWTRQYAWILGHWVDDLGLVRYALDAQVEGDANLPPHQEPARCAVAARALSARVDS